MVVACTSTGDGSTSSVCSTSKTGSLLYCGMTASHRLKSRYLTLPSAIKHYMHYFIAGGSQLSLPIAEPKSFAVILKNHHFKVKYLVSNHMR